MTLSLVAFGANSGVNFAANARHLAHSVRSLPGRVLAVSKLYRTPAWPPGAGPDFANAVLILHTNWKPCHLLQHLHRIEARHGRIRDRRWGPRVLDLDLLARGQAIKPDKLTQRQWMDLLPDEQVRAAPDRLILPHPRLQDRPFVLIPLNDVAPLWRHPVTGRTVRSMVAALPAAKRREIRPVGPVDGVVNRKAGA